jgi:methionyl-tRNA formyltransferase
MTPEKLDDAEFINWIAAAEPDVAVVLAYGKIIPLNVLKMFKTGNINIHFSILPSYRGAAPVQWAIINGEKETGVTGFTMNEKLDTGRIICQKKMDIERSDDLISLRDKLVGLSVEVLEESLMKLSQGVPGSEQQGTVSYAPKLKKSDGRINWALSSERIYNLVRGTKPSPCAFVEFQNKIFKIDRMKILECEVTELPAGASANCAPGCVVSVVKDVGFIVKCGEGFLLVKTVHPSSKNVMSAWAFLQGYKIKTGDVLE